MNGIKVIFIHGNGGSTPHDHWFPYLKRNLERIGCKVIAPQFPHALLAKEADWMPFLMGLDPDEQTILVGHSSGAICAMRYAEKHRLLGTVLVSAYASDLDNEWERLSGYFDRPWDWKAIRKNQEWIIQLAGENDPWIAISEAREVRDRLHTEYFEFSTGGHLGGESGKREFPELWNALKSKLPT